MLALTPNRKQADRYRKLRMGVASNLFDSLIQFFHFTHQKTHAVIHYMMFLTALAALFALAFFPLRIAGEDAVIV